MDLVRMPIFGTRAIDDPYNQIIWDTAITAQEKGLLIFPSIANGDGVMNNLHNAAKFGSFLKCACPFNVYSLNYDAYSVFIDDYIDALRANGVSIDYLGPFNEDPAAASDYRKLWEKMTESEFSRVGVETWALKTGVTTAANVSEHLDIAGSHFYDDDKIAEAEHTATWENFVSVASAANKPAWFTESTRFSIGETEMEKTVNGINQIFPAIRGGVERVIIYQAANRLVWYNGTGRNFRFRPLKQFITSSLDKKVAASTSNLNEIKVLAFVNEESNLLSINLTNKSAEDKSIRVQLKNSYKGDGTTTRTIFTNEQQGAVNTYPMNGGAWRVLVPAYSYVHLDTPIKLSP